jgi:3-oxoacyl-(acyl-carrier-protein) synthase
MSLGIAGMGWVTPLGSGVAAVWERLMAGDEAEAETVSSTVNARTYRAYRVPASATASAPAHPRLRRSSAISRFAVVAGLAALEDAGLKFDAASAERTAVIFAISNGGVVYTKRFYHEVVESGAQAASPLLFPETVFNAPASHLAAILGITGASYTVVGDGAVGLLAIKMAEDLMLNPHLDRCLVVGAEEADWLLCDAYRRWRLLRASPPAEPFRSPPRGMVLSEGAGAVLIERERRVRLEKVHPGCNFHRQAEAAQCLTETLGALEPRDEDLIVASANGTFIDNAERTAIRAHSPAARVYTPKAALGESVGASSIWQVICAVQALRTGEIPPVLHSAPAAGLRVDQSAATGLTLKRAIVSTCGTNQQVAGLSIRSA